MTSAAGPASAQSTRTAPLAEQLLDATRSVRPVAPLRTRFPELTIEDAYEIQRAVRASRLRAGEVLVGQKIGLTSVAMQKQLGIGRPDFGFITDAMLRRSPAVLPRQELIDPMIEAEVAFLFEEELPAEVTTSDVIDRCSAVAPALEVIDSRIAGWDIGIVDTVADNASCAAVVLGELVATPEQLDSRRMRLLVGDVSVSGEGAAVLGHPARPIVWLARTLAALGERVGPGIVISGAWAKAIPIDRGGRAEAVIEGIGPVSLEVR